MKVADATHANNNFDAVRVLAAAAVIFGHAHPLSGQPDLGVLGNATGTLAVKIFFIISGYLVARSWARDPSPIRYLQKRCLRIFPALLWVLLLTVFVLGPLFTTVGLSTYFTDPGTWRYLGYNLALYPDYNLPGVFAQNVYPAAVNGSLWSLPVEFAMYLLFPVIYAATRVTRSNRFLIVFAIAFCAASLYWVRIAKPDTPVVLYGTSLTYALDVGPYFFLGAVFAVTRLHRLLDPVIALFAIGLVAFFQPSGAVSSEVVLFVLAPYCVLAFANASTPVLRSAGRHGDLSYGLYLYGFPVQQALFSLFGPVMTPVQNAVCALVIAALFAFVSWHLVERRALALKPVSPSRRLAIPPAPAI